VGQSHLFGFLAFPVEAQDVKVIVEMSKEANKMNKYWQ